MLLLQRLVEDLEEVDGKPLLRKTGEPYSGKVFLPSSLVNKSDGRGLCWRVCRTGLIRWNQSGAILQGDVWEKGKLREWLGNDKLFEQWFSHDKAGLLVAEHTGRPFTGVVRWLRSGGSN